MKAIEKCAEVASYILSLLNNTSISETMAEYLVQADEEDIDNQYAQALVSWVQSGRCVLESFITDNALFLHFRQAIQNHFGLEILSQSEAQDRAKMLEGQTWLPHFQSIND